MSDDGRGGVGKGGGVFNQLGGVADGGIGGGADGGSPSEAEGGSGVGAAMEGVTPTAAALRRFSSSIGLRARVIQVERARRVHERLRCVAAAVNVAAVAARSATAAMSWRMASCRARGRAQSSLVPGPSSMAHCTASTKFSDAPRAVVAALVPEPTPLAPLSPSSNSSTRPLVTKFGVVQSKATRNITQADARVTDATLGWQLTRLDPS